MGDLIERLKGLQEWKAAAHKNHTARCGFTACMTKKRATDEGEEWGYVNLGDVMGVAEEAADELALLRAEVAENKREIDELVRAVNLGSERAKKAERERDELRRMLGKAHNYIESLKIGLEIADEIDGRVRLDAEEGK